MKEKKTSISHKIWTLLYPYLVYEGVTLAVMLGISLVITLQNWQMIFSAENVQASVEALSETLNRYSNFSLILACAITIPLELLFIRKDRKQEAEEGSAQRYEKLPLYTYAVPLLAGIAACLLLNNLIYYSRLYELYYEGFEVVGEALYSGTIIADLIAVCVFSPLTEELIFRGLVYNRMKRYTPGKAAFLMSAVYFGLFHGNMLQFIYTFLLALMLNLVYDRYHSLLAPILMHMGANIVSVLGSETALLNFMYGSTGLFLGVTFAAALLLAVLLYLILTYIYPRRLDTPAPMGAEGPSVKEET